MPAGCIFTIGHSNRSIEFLVEMIRGAGADLVIDVRSFPRSRTNPQFNIDVLPSAFTACQIGYEHWPELGGRRASQAGVDPRVNGFWENRSFHNYADYALSEPFARALRALIERGRHRRPVLMCSEAVWWRCHRRIITDHLLAAGVEVRHIMDVGKITQAKLTPGAWVRPGGGVEYPMP